MTDEERPDQEPSNAGTPGASIGVKGRRALSRLRRELTDEDLANPAVGRMLIDEVERLERDALRASDYHERLIGAEKRVVLLEERARKSLSGEVIFGGCLALGGIVFGYAPVAWSHQPAGVLSLVVGALLMAIGIAARMVQR